MKFDVIVIGGSAIGGAAAAACSKYGLKTAILEEDKEVGKYKRCTAICSENGLKKTKISYTDAILNKIRGGVIHSPNNEVKIKMKSNIGIVFDRQKFDENSIERALRFGSELFMEKRAISFYNFNNHYSVFAGNTFHSKIIVGADGVASKTASEFNFPQFKKIAYCFEKEVTNVNVPHLDLVDIYVDNENLPGFFGWCVPVDEKTVRVGFGVTKLNKLLDAKKFFFSQKSLSFLGKKTAKTLRKFNAAIPLGPRELTQIKGVLLVGDAAGQTKATTGGGLVFGSQCAHILGEAVSDHINKGEKLEYEKRWRKEFGSTLYLHNIFRRGIDLLPNYVLDFSVSFLKIPFINRFLSEAADMDYIIRI
ncbi:MAG: geranylgeranyl reductase family protein [Candidatus Micrarchaeia archaeon]